MPGAGDRLSELDLRFMGGTYGPVNLACVINGCSLACWGDHRSRGCVLSKPRTKSMNAVRLLISIHIVGELLVNNSIKHHTKPNNDVPRTHLDLSRTASCPFAASGMT